MTKNTDGLNDRPTDDTIAQTSSDIRDASSSPIDASDEEMARIHSALTKGNQKDEKPLKSSPNARNTEPPEVSRCQYRLPPYSS